jgi:hypothetical protein
MSASSGLDALIARAYAIIGRATPLSFDCGKLCGGACCRDGNSAGDSNDDGGNNDGGGNDGCDGACCRDGNGADNDACAGGADSGSAGYAVGTEPAGAAADGSGAEAGADASDTAAAADANAATAAGAGSSDAGAGARPLSAYASRGAAAREEMGMLLFPGEARRMHGVAGFKISRIKYMGKRVWFMTCAGACSRWTRPLACRVFPLAPHVDGNGNVSALPDPRAARMCPLADGAALDRRFRAAVGRAFDALAQEPKMLSFMQSMSLELEEMRRFTGAGTDTGRRRTGAPRPSGD